MASIILRSRTFSHLSKSKLNHRRIFSSEAASTNLSAKEPAAAAAAGESLLPNVSPIPEPLPESGAAQVTGWKSLRYLAYGLVGALTGAAAATGYVSYAYTLDDVRENTKTLRESVKHIPEDDASDSFLQKYKGLLYSTTMAASAKAIELYLELRETVEEQVRSYTEPTSEKLLPDLHPQEQHAFTLVLDLNDTLLFTDWKRERGWRTFKRPGVEAFLEHLAQYYEIVVYSDQMDMFVMPVCEKLDPKNYIRYRLARGATKYVDGKHYRDLSKLNRNPEKILYVSGNAFETSLQPENCVPIKPYKLEEDDTALLDLIPFLEYVARNSPADIRQVLASYERKDIAKEFLERSKEYQKRIQGQRQQKRWWQV